MRFPARSCSSPITAAVVVLLAALLLGAAAAAGRGRRRTVEIGALLEPHVTRGDLAAETPADRYAGFESLLDWTERSLDDLPGRSRLAQMLERSGLKLRRGPHPVPRAPHGLRLRRSRLDPRRTTRASRCCSCLPASPRRSSSLRIVAHRRTQAFDRQLPDVLATIASTLRAGHGLRPALRAIADDSAAPASEEFARVLGEERLGLPLDQAINAMCRRIGSRRSRVRRNRRQRPGPDRRLARRPLRHAVGDGARAATTCPESARADLARPDVGNRARGAPDRPRGADDA